jgi:hypothetical protein
MTTRRCVVVGGLERASLAMVPLRSVSALTPRVQTVQAALT